MDRKESLETWEDQVHLDFKVYEELQGGEVPEELWVLQGRQGSQVKMGKTEILDLRDYRGCLVQWGYLETKVQWENKVIKEILVFQDNKDQEEIQERMACLEIMGHKVHLGLQEIEELQEVQVLEGFRDYLGHLVRMV